MMTVTNLSCPGCGARHFDLCAYDSMMVLGPDIALFTLSCPACKTKVSVLKPIPDELREDIRCAALEVGAGMGASE